MEDSAIETHPPGFVLQDFWQSYYEAVVAQSTPWLDYSNHRVQLQSLTAVMDAAGGVLGSTCLDVGCGRGQLSLVLKALGASAITGIDFNGAVIHQLQTDYADLCWKQGSISDPGTFQGLNPFDRVFALEVLQYVELESCVPLLWQTTAPGGRFVAMAPNRECPIVGKTIQRFPGRYAPVSPSELRDAFLELADVEVWAMRGLWFGEDQHISPYELSPWTTECSWNVPPNRLLFVAQRRQGSRV